MTDRWEDELRERGVIRKDRHPELFERPDGLPLLHHDDYLFLGHPKPAWRLASVEEADAVALLGGRALLRAQCDWMLDQCVRRWPEYRHVLEPYEWGRRLLDG